MKALLYFSLLFFTSVSSCYSQEYYLESKESGNIVRITTGTGKQYYGEVTFEDEKSLKLKTEKYGIIVLSKSNIINRETTSEEEIKLDQEALQTVKEYFLTPSANTLKRGQSSFSNSYFAYWNFEKGVTDNLTIDVGFTVPLLMPLRLGLKTGLNLGEKVRIGCKLNAYSFINYGAAGNGSGRVRSVIPMTVLLQANPMVTIGGTNSNVTIGGTVNYLFSNTSLTYGGFMGLNYRFSEKFSVMAEGIIVNFENSLGSTNMNKIFSGSIGAKYFRGDRKTLSFGLTSAIFPVTYSSGPDEYFVLPLPYVGYRVLFR
jgi:hypothetical protein